MEDVFYGYIEKGALFGVFYCEDNSLKKVLGDLGFDGTRELFSEIKWFSPSPDLNEDEADDLGYENPMYLFIELCRKKDIKETLKTQYGIMKFLNSRPNDPVFDGVLDEYSKNELKNETKQELKELKNTQVLELFNQAYKVKGDYRNAKKYFVVNFDSNSVMEK